jgi:calcineurin-like phosphoesterase family protein
MDAKLIENWNATIKMESDIIYHMGDFAFSKKPRIKEIISQLKGRIVLVMGNHDLDKSVSFWLDAGIEQVHKLGYAKVHEMVSGVYLSHYPQKTFMQEYESNKERAYLLPHAPDNQKGVLLHGHVHTQWRFKGNNVNVGCDMWDYRPTSIGSVLTQYQDWTHQQDAISMIQ